MPTQAARYLRCESHVDPIGIGEARPRLSWEVDDPRRGARQTAYEILAASSREALDADRGDLWASGKVASDACAEVPYAGTPLTNRARCWWKVRTWDAQGTASPWSAVARFEIGLIAPYTGFRLEWKAQTIRSALRGDRKASPPAPHFRRTFTVDKPVERARLYVTALGLYEAQLNGRVVTDDVYRPGWTDYRYRVPYQAYDVTALVRQGENVLGAIVGDGWYCGHVVIAGGRQAYGERPALVGQIEVHFADGSAPLVVATDKEWKWSAGPILAADNYNGETYDARREIAGWSLPGFDANAWQPVECFPFPQAALVATVAPPVRRLETLEPIATWESAPGVHVFDMGQNMVGRIRLRVTAPAGTELKLRHAEVLHPETRAINPENLREAAATDVYVCRGGGEEVWEPRFTFHGFRYVELTGHPGKPPAETIRGVVLNSDMPRTGRFECSHPGITKLHENIVWTQRGNSLDVPTDCPQRAERLGWCGDIAGFGTTATLIYDAASFLSKYVTDVIDAQLPAGVEEGQFPMFAPRGTAKGGGPGWADVGIEIPWTLYRAYGDKHVLARAWHPLERWMAFLDRCAAGHGTGAYLGFGDWVSLDFDPGHLLGEGDKWGGTPLEFLRAAFHAHAADLMGRIADVLGRGDDAKSWRGKFEELRESFAANHLKDGRLAKPTQTACSLVLRFGLAADPKVRAAFAAALAADVERRGHLVTGIIGTPHLMHALDLAGRVDLAYKLIEREAPPGWLHMIAMGATTVWERWDCWSPDKGFKDEMSSLNHYAHGSVGHWMYRTIGGLDVADDGPGWRRIRVAPRPGGSVTWAKAEVRTPRGRAATSWKLEGGRFVLETTIPPSSSAHLRLPARDPEAVTESGTALHRVEGVSAIAVRDGAVWCELAAGTYRFEVVEPTT